jgi:hypothetical protein
MYREREFDPRSQPRPLYAFSGQNRPTAPPQLFSGQSLGWRKPASLISCHMQRQLMLLGIREERKKERLKKKKLKKGD